MSPAFQTRLFHGSRPELEELANSLREGALCAIPTETVYGLAAHALDPAACRRIFEIKGRPLIDPLIVHVADLDQAARLSELPPGFCALAETFWPGPLTLIAPRHPVVPDIVTAERPTVAIRSPAHPLTRRLLETSGLPLAAPSANPFGYVSPTRIEHVLATLGERLEYALDGGPCTIGIESTILDLTSPEQPLLRRPGAITAGMIETVLGREVATAREKHQNPSAPGEFSRHYSPRTTIGLVDAAGDGNRSPQDPLEAILRAGFKPGLEAAILFRRPTGDLPPETAASSGENLFWLTEGGDPDEAARNLFALLQRCDDGRFKRLWIERPPATGIGLALNDRLERAAATG